MAHKLCRYVNWIGLEARTFISVSYAARHVERTQRTFDTDFLLSHVSNLEQWTPILDNMCADMKEFIGKPAKSAIAILDLICCTPAFWKYIHNQLLECFDTDRIIFLEIVVDDARCEHLIRIKAQESPEYRGVDEEKAVADIKRRIAGIKEHYEPVTDEFAYIRAQTHRHTLNHIKGYLPARIVNWVLNSQLAQTSRPIYFFPPPENVFSHEARLGGNPDLTERGKLEARRCFHYLSRFFTPDTLEVWTSGLRRSIQTAEPFAEAGFPTKCWLALNEINMGACEGLTPKEVAHKFPFIEELRVHNKYYFRFPRGESYLDLVHRLDRIILSLDRAEKAVLVLGHRAVLRELLTYYHEAPAEEGVQRKLPSNVLWKYAATPCGKPAVQEIHLSEDQEVGMLRSISGDDLDLQ